MSLAVSGNELPNGTGGIFVSFYYDSYRHSIGLFSDSDRRGLNLVVAPMCA